MSHKKIILKGKKAEVVGIGYEKITLQGKRAKLFKIISETPILVFAREVDKEGEDKDYYDKNDTLIQTVHMMDKDIIQKRVKMVIDKKYSELREDRKTL